MVQNANKNIYIKFVWLNDHAGPCEDGSDTRVLFSDGLSDHQLLEKALLYTSNLSTDSNFRALSPNTK
jgi:hypothetical protein